MTLQDILRVKGSAVHSITPQATLDEVVQKLVRNNCGSLVVCDAESCTGEPLGIITERDILRACAVHQGALDRVTVAEVMSRDLITGSPGDSVEHIMGVMTENRVRHLPVVEAGRLLGIISIGDVVKAEHDHLSLENHYLKSYIQS